MTCKNNCSLHNVLVLLYVPKNSHALWAWLVVRNRPDIILLEFSFGNCDAVTVTNILSRLSAVNRKTTLLEKLIFRKLFKINQ